MDSETEEEAWRRDGYKMVSADLILSLSLLFSCYSMYIMKQHVI